MKPKYAILAIAFITSVITGVLLPFSASAVSSYDNAIKVVPEGELELYDEGIFGGPVTERFDVSGTWTDYILNEDYLCNSPGTDYTTLIESFDEEIVPGGSWAVSITNTYALSKSYSVINVYWTIDDSQLQGIFDNDPYQRFKLDLTTGDNVYMWQIIPNAFGSGTSGSNDTGFCGQSVGVAGTSSNREFSNEYGNTVRTTTGGSHVGMFLFNSTDVTYPEDYEGEQVPASASQGTVPDFGYTITSEKKLTAIYLRNIDTIVSGHRFQYKVYQSNETYDEVELLDSKELDIYPVYEFTLPSTGFYLLKIKHVVPPPGLPMPQIKEVVFKIDFSSGQFQSGSTRLNTCEDGVCAPAEIICSEYTDVFQQINCNVQKQLSFGVINPSITAFKNLVLAFTVPSTPTCSIPVSANVAIGSAEFPLSSYATNACSETEEFRDAFPIMALALNSVFALGILVMIVAIINRLTDKSKNNLIEGV